MNKVQKIKGFSLIELSMVIAVIALLTIGANFAFNSIRDNRAYDEAVNMLTIYFPQAIDACFRRAGHLRNCDTDRIVQLSPMTDQTNPWTNHADGHWRARAAIPESTAITEGLENRPDGGQEYRAVALKFSTRKFATGGGGNRLEEQALALDLAEKINDLLPNAAAMAGTHPITTVGTRWGLDDEAVYINYYEPGYNNFTRY